MDEGEQTKTREIGPGPLRVLPCVNKVVLSKYFAALRSEMEIDLLSVAHTSALASRVRNDQPDAIVIVAEEFTDFPWRERSSLREVFSATPTLLLAGKVDASLRLRAAGFHIRSTLPLDLTTDQLRAAIWATVAGLTVTLEPSSLEEDEYSGWHATDKRFVEEALTEYLTARETAVLRLMALGYGNKEIALRLNISEHTVKFHVSSVLAKLGAASRTEAVTIGIMRGLVVI